MAMISEERNHKPAAASMSSIEQPRETILSAAIHRRFPAFTLDIAFAVPAGLTVLFGPSGAGKSLTLQALAGLIHLDYARITFAGDIWHESARGIVVPPQSRQVGYVPQQYALFPHLTVEQNIAFGIVAARAEKKQRAADLVELVQLRGLERMRPAQLSGGQQQRVALARALAVQPRLLLLDEPFSSLDAPVRETLRDELRTLQQRIGLPVILVTHDAQEASALADTMVVVSGGRVLQTSSQETVFRSPLTRSVARLVGMETCWQGEIAEVEVASADTRGRLVSIQTADAVVYAYAPPAFKLSRGQHVEFGIRTDELHLQRVPAAGEEMTEARPHCASLPGRVVHTQPRRILHLVTVRLTDGSLLDIPMMRREYRELELDAGSAVSVQMPPSAIHVFAPSDT